MGKVSLYPSSDIITRSSLLSALKKFSCRMFMSAGIVPCSLRILLMSLNFMVLISDNIDYEQFLGLLKIGEDSPLV